MDLTNIKPRKIMFEHTHINGSFNFDRDKYLSLINNLKKYDYKVIQSP